MLNHLAEQLRLPTDGASRSADASASGDAPDAHGAGYLDRVPARSRACRSGATRSTASSSRSACSCRTCRTPCTSRYRLLDGDGPRAARRCGPSVHFRAHEAPVSEPLGWPYALTRRRRPLRDLPAGTPLPPLRLLLHGARRGVHARRARRLDDVLYRVEESRGYEARGDLWSPGYFRVDAARRASASRWSPRPRPWETIDALTPDEALDAERERRRAAARACADPRRATGIGRRAGARRRPVHHHAGRPRRGRGARARRRRRGAHGHRRLSLVHRLGPRHDDQPRRADARDRPARARRATSCARSPTTSATA